MRPGEKASLGGSDTGTAWGLEATARTRASVNAGKAQNRRRKNTQQRCTRTGHSPGAELAGLQVALSLSEWEVSDVKGLGRDAPHYVRLSLSTTWRSLGRDVTQVMMSRYDVMPAMMLWRLPHRIIIIWGHRHICGPSWTKMSLCDIRMYRKTFCTR